MPAPRAQLSPVHLLDGAKVLDLRALLVLHVGAHRRRRRQRLETGGLREGAVAHAEEGGERAVACLSDVRPESLRSALELQLERSVGLHWVQPERRPARLRRASASFSRAALRNVAANVARVAAQQSTLREGRQ